MKKLLALLLALVMVFSLVACGTDDRKNNADDTNEEIEKETNKGNEEPEEPDEPGEPEEPVDVNVLEDDDLKYVMIYNPNIYDENSTKDKSQLKTGELGSQVDTDAYRGDGLDDGETPEIIPISQNGINMGLPMDKIDFEGNRGDGVAQEYAEGDVRDFYCFDTTMNANRTSCEFTCAYEGEYCYVWIIDGDLSTSKAKTYGKEFDDNIYETAVDMFGEPRFAGEGEGKVHLLFYPFYEAYLGVFYNGDLFATGELTAKEVREYGVNLDHAILSVNSYIADNKSYEDTIFGTMAHEFQHLLCFTAFFETVNGSSVRTWLNEAMSGYIEEYLYEGTKEDAGHYESLMESDLVRYGQSLYNFTTDVSYSDFDIGVYGSVYMFAEYLADLAGDDVFSDIHEYWRESYSDTLCESEAIVESVSSDVYEWVDYIVDYDDKVDFDTDYDEWMSKLVLAFYLDFFAQADVDAFKEINMEELLYADISGADIEGGGRIIFAVNDNMFEIPEDADGGLVYVGLDEDFEIVTDIIVK